MKRSDINEILGHTRQFFSMHDVHLPPFASFPPTKWQQLDQAAWQEVFDLKLGWDVTAFGGNNFAAEGLTLFTLRNGSPNGVPYEKSYAEKIMHVRDGQVTPMHFHWRKREDIINRGGGNLIIELWNAGAHEETENTAVTVTVDGCRQTHAPGSQLRLTPGESICLTPTLYHSFWEGGKHAQLTVKGPQVAEQPAAVHNGWREDFDVSSLDPELQTLRIPFDDTLGSLTARPGYLRLYGNDSLNSTFTQSTVARRWQHFAFRAETRMQFSPVHFQQSAGLTCYYNSKNWSYCFVDYEEEQGRTIKVIQLDHNVPSWPLHEQPIPVPESAESVWLRVDVDTLVYRYSYSFDGETWHTVPVTYEAWKLSDDYIGGRGFFTGAFVGLHCEDISGDGCHADFDYFTYEPV